MTTSAKRAAIVGAGLAGDRCAFALRQTGFEGPITLIGAEPIRPYDRPPLSKSVLKSVGAEDEIFYRDEAEYVSAGIELMLSRTVVGASLEEHSLTMSTSERLAYDVLVLATGSRLREVDSLPRGTDGVFYLRDRADALALRTALEAGGRVAVIGGGVIGLEAAAAAAENAAGSATASLVRVARASAISAVAVGVAASGSADAFDTRRSRSASSTFVSTGSSRALASRACSTAAIT